MVQLQVVEEGAVGAPAELVYRYIADYREHHHHFLAPSLTDLQVDAGGYGAGTIFRVNATFAGQVRVLKMRVDEPDPGTVLTESDLESPLVTTWTITPEGANCRVRIATIWPSSGGVQGLLERLVAPRTMRKMYRVELARLDRYAREQAGAARLAG